MKITLTSERLTMFPINLDQHPLIVAMLLKGRKHGS